MDGSHLLMPHVSPSQINTFKRCPRRWGFSRVAERTSTPATRFGTRVHEILENWLEHKTLPSANTDEGLCALSGISHLPMPKTDGMVVEAPLDMVYDGVTYVGRIDLLIVDGDAVTVLDHKTCSDLRWMKTEDELLDDPQRIVYSHWAATTQNVAHVTAKWVYYQKRPPESRVVEFTESAETIAERFDELHKKYALRIIQSAGRDPMTLEPNYDACGDYGGCPHRTTCHKDLTLAYKLDWILE